jgi:hypothetical protein
VLEDGQIREAGTHRELVRAGGAYAALWNSWHGAGTGSGGSTRAPSFTQAVDKAVDGAVETSYAQGINN